MTELPGWLPLAGLGLAGLLVGSFLNVVIARVPEGRSVTRPASSCPRCGTPLRPADNVPVVSWLLLHGRCRACREPISVRYPAVELATGALFLVAGLRFGWTWFLLVALVLVSAGTALFVIDLRHRRLPFVITGVAGCGVALGLVLEALQGGQLRLMEASASVALWTAVYGAVWLGTSGMGMGLGDVALAPVLGAALGWLGWGPSLVGLLGGFVIGAAGGLTLMLTGRATRRSSVPHGPSMLAGSAVGLLAGEHLWQGYLELFRIE